MSEPKKKQFQSGDEVMKTFVPGYVRPSEPRQPDPKPGAAGQEVAQQILRGLQERLDAVKSAALVASRNCLGSGPAEEQRLPTPDSRLRSLGEYCWAKRLDCVKQHEHLVRAVECLDEALVGIAVGV